MHRLKNRHIKCLSSQLSFNERLKLIFNSFVLTALGAILEKLSRCGKNAVEELYLSGLFLYIHIYSATSVMHTISKLTFFFPQKATQTVNGCSNQVNYNNN